MGLFVSPAVKRLVPYSPGKPLEELERDLGIHGAIKLASNENPWGPSPKVKEAVAQGLRDLGRYPDAATHLLRAHLAEHFSVDSGEVVVGNGSNELIDLICRTFVSAEHHGVFADPSFVCYRLGLTAANVPFSEVALRGRLHWNVDDLLAAVRPQTRLMFVANPNNPTGTYVPSIDLRRLVRELPPDVMLVIDEAYAEYATADDYESAIALRSMREQLVVLRTFSKIYGLAALRVGYGVATPEVVDLLNRVRAPFNVNALGQLAAIVALADQDYMRACAQRNHAERKRLTARLEELGLAVAPSQANFVLVDMARPGGGVYEALLRKGVIVRPMPFPIETWLRVTVGTEEENDRFMRAIAEQVATGGG